MSNKKETPEQPITDISIYVAALSTTYRPASAPTEATHFFSTAEVVDAIRGIDNLRSYRLRAGILRTPRCRIQVLQPPRGARLRVQMDVP